MRYATALLEARTAAAMTQAEVSARCGVARPNVAAFEAGSREPRWDTAVRTIEATGASVEITEPVSWSWTTGRRPYAIASRLWRLPLAEAFRTLTPEFHLWWSGPTPKLNLAGRLNRIKAYELVLREGGPEDIRSVVDGALLIEAWDDLVLPADLRSAWQPVLDEAVECLAEAT